MNEESTENVTWGDRGRGQLTLLIVLLAPVDAAPVLIDAGSALAVAAVPLAVRVVARLVAVAVLDPALRAAVLTVRHRPRQVHLRRVQLTCTEQNIHTHEHVHATQYTSYYTSLMINEIKTVLLFQYNANILFVYINENL